MRFIPVVEDPRDFFDSASPANTDAVKQIQSSKHTQEPEVEMNKVTNSTV